MVCMWFSWFAATGAFIWEQCWLGNFFHEFWWLFILCSAGIQNQLCAWLDLIIVSLLSMLLSVSAAVGSLMKWYVSFKFLFYSFLWVFTLFQPFRSCPECISSHLQWIPVVITPVRMQACVWDLVQTNISVTAPAPASTGTTVLFVRTLIVKQFTVDEHIQHAFKKNIHVYNIIDTCVID